MKVLFSIFVAVCLSGCTGSQPAQSAPQSRVTLAGAEINRSKPYQPTASGSVTAFTRGSSMDEVAVVMGKPESVFNESSLVCWKYGTSTVNFRNGRVAYWVNPDRKLRTYLPPISAKAIPVHPEKVTPSPSITISENEAKASQRVVTTAVIRPSVRYYNRSTRIFTRYPAPSPNLQEESADLAGSGSWSVSSGTSSGPKTVAVKGYYRKDGTYVQPHTRSAPRR
jgi:hypothetical protein